MPKEGIGGLGIFLRVLFALILVYATYNPEGLSYYHWTIVPLKQATKFSFSAIHPLKFLAGVALLVGWIIFLQATQRSLGLKGVVLALALFGGLVWLLIYWDVFSPRGARAISHIVLLVLALVLATGMSWSHLSRRLTGQIDTDEVG
ncbi:hypothetical protein HUU05_25495 [candidate division KSB1 bacterium]|nr:hypothetical protein [candidate division KSB1 bacterium]